MMQPNFEKILAQYRKARTNEPFGKTHELRPVFEAIKADLIGSLPVRLRPTLNIKWSVGYGSWAKVPWISILHTDEGRTVMRMSCAYIFRQDMSGLYLAPILRVSDVSLKWGSEQAMTALRKRVASLRVVMHGLEAQGFALDDNIDLRADAGLGKQYEVATVAHKFYRAGVVPPDTVLLSDLQDALAAYDLYLSQRAPDGLSPLLYFEGADPVVLDAET
jgi:hypothetical protein